MDARADLYAPIEPYDSGMLALDDIHTMYWEVSGNPRGVPIVFLHGGPGGGCSPENRRFFDPDFFRIVLYDQRGAGASSPIGEAATAPRWSCRGRKTTRLNSRHANISNPVLCLEKT